MRRALFAAVISAGFATSPASAADAPPTFELPTGTFNAPLPDGFCVPSGGYEAVAKMLAAADTANLTDITYIDCNDIAAGTGQFTGWGMIKTPLVTLKAKVGARAPVLAQLKTDLNTDAGRKTLDITSDDLAAKSNLNKVFGDDFKGSAKFEPFGSDDNGVYFGGIANYNNGKGGTLKVAVAYAITVANNSVFSIYLYKPFSDVSDITELLKRVKAETVTFLAANGG